MPSPISTYLTLPLTLDHRSMDSANITAPRRPVLPITALLEAAPLALVVAAEDAALAVAEAEPAPAVVPAEALPAPVVVVAAVVVVAVTEVVETVEMVETVVLVEMVVLVETVVLVRVTVLEVTFILVDELNEMDDDEDITVDMLEIWETLTVVVTGTPVPEMVNGIEY